MTYKFTLLDGGMGRELDRMGAPFQQPEWSALTLMEAPQFVQKAHENFIASGAQVITTNAYAVVPFHIGQQVFEKDGERLAALAGELALNATVAATHKVQIAGCIPPVCGSYMPEKFEPGKATSWINCLVKAQDPFVDFWLAETVSSILEIKTIHDTLGNNKKPLWVSFTVEEQFDEKAKPILRSGESVEDAIKIVKDMGVQAVLFNCSRPEDMTGALKVAQKILKDSIPYGAYANAFDHQDEGSSANEEVTDMRTDMSPAEYAEFAKTWLGLGATIIGGCCGIGPEHIKALNKLKQ